MDGANPDARSADARPGRSRLAGDVRCDAVKVSTRGDYASRALLSLALHADDGPTSVRDIAERTGLPQPYLEQILLALKGAGLVRSKRGVGGGYVLARAARGHHAGRDRRARSTARSWPATSASPTPTAPATTRASASCSPSGPTSATTCEVDARGVHAGRHRPTSPGATRPGRASRPGPDRATTGFGPRRVELGRARRQSAAAATSNAALARAGWTKRELGGRGGTAGRPSSWPAARRSARRRPRGGRSSGEVHADLVGATGLQLAGERG